MEEYRQYHKENGVSLIEMRLTNVQQLFNSLDPSPFHEKDLDEDAENYIVTCTQDFSLSEKLKLVFYLPPEQVMAPRATDIKTAIQNYFAYCFWAERRKLKQHLRQARSSLIIGLIFLFICLALSEAVNKFENIRFVSYLSESLIIMGWVALWGPLENLLFGWWPIWHKSRIFAKLRDMEVEIRPSVSTQLPSDLQHPQALRRLRSRQAITGGSGTL